MNQSTDDKLSWAQWQLVLLLAAINFIHILDFVIVMPLGERLRSELAITPQQFGFIVSAYGTAAMLAGITAATVIDRFDRKTVMLASFAGFAMTTLYCGLAPNYFHLLVARCLAGACGGVLSSGMMAFIGDKIPHHLRGRALGIVTSSFAVASILGLPIGLWLAEGFHHFSAPFVAIAGAAVVVWLIAAWQLPTCRGHMERTDRAHPMTEFMAVLRNRNHQISFAFMLSMVLATFMIVPYIATYYEANCGFGRHLLPWLYAIGGVSSLVFMNLCGWMTDRIGAWPVFLVCAGTAVVMSIVITNLPVVSAVTAITAATVFMTFASSRVVPAQTMMIRVADPQLRGAFMSINTAVSHLATSVGPIISGSIIGERFKGGPLTHYWMVGLIAAGFGVAAMTLSTKLHRIK